MTVYREGDWELLEEPGNTWEAPAHPGSCSHPGSSSGVANSSVGAEGQTGSAARLIARLEAEAYGTWQQAFVEVYGR